MKPRERKTALAAVEFGGFLKQFMPLNQRANLIHCIKSDEGGFFIAQVLNLIQTIEEMPETYESDGMGLDALVYLHYFCGSVDAWVTEKDRGDGPEDTEQTQAFGKVCLTGNKEDAEMGYINIAELIKNGIELDLYWTPKPLREI